MIRVCLRKQTGGYLYHSLQLSLLSLQTDTGRFVPQSCCWSIRDLTIRHIWIWSLVCVCVCSCVNEWVGSDVWRRQVSRAFECGKQEARPMSEGSHLAPGFQWRVLVCVCVCVSPCLLLSLEEMQEPIIVLLNTVPLCDHPPSNLHTGSSVDNFGPESVIFPGNGSGFEAPCPRLWSIRPLLNEKAVKGHKAGVHVRACVCSCSLEVFCQFAENVQSSKADHVLLSFTAHSVVDKTLEHMQTNYGVRMGCYQSRQKNQSNIKFWGYEQQLMEWNRMLRSTCLEK